MTKFMQVDEGDCCSSLAAKYGFSDYKPFYEQQPGAFKALHPNPNQLSPKAICIVPDVKQKNTSAATARLHEFNIHGSNVHLKIKLLDAGDQPLQVKSCMLELGATPGGHMFVIPPETVSGGMIDQKDIPVDITAGWLAARLTPPPTYTHPFPAKRPAYTANTKMPYPPTIQSGTFQDEEDPGYIGQFEEEVEWKLEIGYLATYKEESGVSARLENLGFSLEQGLPAAVETFQIWFNAKHNQSKPTTGKWDDIQDDIKRIHDDP